MIVLTDNDFRPLTDFELRERWTNPKKDALSEQTLSHFHPLTHSKAAKLWDQTGRYRNELWDYAFKAIPEPLLDSSAFTAILRIDANSEGIERTTNELLSLGLPHEEFVVVMWDRDIAIGISWWEFCHNWSDLCYPSSDDVSICPLSESWFLQYHHEDQFVFGRRRAGFSAHTIKEAPVMPGAVVLHRDEILRLLQANEKIAAIKLYQKETGVPFKVAIEEVDKLARELQ